MSAKRSAETAGLDSNQQRNATRRRPQYFGRLKQFEPEGGFVLDDSYFTEDDLRFGIRILPKDGVVTDHMLLYTDEEPGFALRWSEIFPNEQADNKYSDWSVTVESECGLKRTFAVHQPVLASKCEFFSAHFSAVWAGNQDNSSHFTFDKIIVENFDVFLDMIYTKLFLDHFPFLTEDQACVLFYLVDFFQVIEYFKKRFNRAFSTLVSTDWFDFSVLERFRPPNLLDFVIDSIAERRYFDADYEGMPPDIFIQLVQHPRSDQELWEDKLVTYVDNDTPNISAEIFVRLTHENVWKFDWSWSTSIWVLQKLHHFRELTSDTEVLSSLKRLEDRCITALEPREVGYVFVAVEFLQEITGFDNATISATASEALVRLAMSCTQSLSRLFVFKESLAKYDKWKRELEKLCPRFLQNILCLVTKYTQPQNAACADSDFGAISMTKFSEQESNDNEEQLIGGRDFIPAIRAVLIVAKKVHAASVPIAITKLDKSLRGSYKRKRNGLYIKEDCSEVARMEKDAEGMWSILRSKVTYNGDTRKRVSSVVYTSASGRNKDIPPSAGWEDVDGNYVEIVFGH